MRVAFILLFLSLFAVSPALAQDTPDDDSGTPVGTEQTGDDSDLVGDIDEDGGTITVTTLSDVLAACEVGSCTAEIDSFLAGRTPEEEDDALVQLVNQFAANAREDEACNDADANYASAIFYAQNFAEGDIQAIGIQTLGESVEACDLSATAAIGDGIDVPSDG